MSPLIEVKNIRKFFKDIRALDGVSMAVEVGTIKALLGPNGAGKTTLVRILTTLLQSDEGEAHIAGFDVVRDAEHLREIIGLSGQFAAVDGNLTGQENLELVGRLYHLPYREVKKRTTDLLERFGLTDAASKTAKTYSGGMCRRLDLAASLIGNPRVLFLDEPTTGLDPRSRLGLWDIIKKLVKDGTTLLLTTQYLEEADRLADDITVIDHGRIIAEGTSSQLKARVSGNVLEVHIAENSKIAEAAEKLRSLSEKELHIDAVASRISIPVKSGTSVLTEAIRRLDAAHIHISDIALHRPTLDDVFLELTGREITND